MKERPRPASTSAWSEVEDHLARLLAAPAGRRAALLDDLRRESPEVAREVAELLAASDQMPDMLQRESFLAEQGDDPWVGRRIGAYRVLRVLGRGGMGAVYLAERVSGEYQQQVALKILPAGDDALHRRFEDERRILAALDHPRIAPILDAGVDSGCPWFCMRYVDGVSLTEAVERDQMDTRGRVRLMIAICDVVAFAHRNLVVHRDLKPSNILVDVAGEPTLVDFGIARLLEADGHEAPTVGTSYFTVLYSAPEQIERGAISTQTDVYALGVLLYELLCGAPPFAEDRSTPFRLADRVVSEPAPRPSTLSARSDRDLDAVVQRALRKEPAARYPSADAMAADLEAWLEHRPVQARQGRWLYRAGRFFRRHWASVALATAVVFALALATWTARRGQLRAERAAARSEQLAEALTDILTLADPDVAAQGELTPRALLESGQARADALRDQPDVEAALRSILAAGYRYLGDYGAAREQAERSWRSWSALGEGLSRSSLESRFEFGEALRLSGELDASGEHFRGVVSSAPPDLADTASDAANSLGLVALAKQDLDSAQEWVERSLELTPPADTARRARAFVNLGRVEESRRNLEQAELHMREGHALLRGHFGPDHSNTVTVLSNLARVVGRTQGLDAAAPLYEEVLAARRRIFGERHPDVAQALNNLAALEVRRGRLEEGQERLRDALAVWREFFDDQHPDVLATRTNLAIVAMRLEEPEVARDHLLAVVDGWQQTGGQEVALADARRRLAVVELALGRAETALRLVEQAVATLERTYAADHPRLLAAQTTRVEALAATGGCASAQSAFDALEEPDPELARSLEQSCSANS